MTETTQWPGSAGAPSSKPSAWLEYAIAACLFVIAILGIVVTIGPAMEKFYG